jgi:hypothetical protein
MDMGKCLGIGDYLSLATEYADWRGLFFNHGLRGFALMIFATNGTNVHEYI